MGKFVDEIRKKLGLEPKRDRTVTGKIPDEVKVNRLQNEETNPMRPFVLAPARMNPPHVGHGEIIKEVLDQAKKHNALHSVVLTRTHQPATAKKYGADTANPMDPETKLHWARKFFPNANLSLAHPDHPSVLHQASQIHKNGHKHLIVVCGSDQVDNYRDTLNKYNGVEGKHGYYNFDKIDVVQAGKKRTEGGKGVEGMSSSNLKAAAAQGKIPREYVPPHISDKEFREYSKHVKASVAPPELSEQNTKNIPIDDLGKYDFDDEEAKNVQGRDSVSSFNVKPDERIRRNLRRRAALKRALQTGALGETTDTIMSPKSNETATSTPMITGEPLAPVKSRKSFRELFGPTTPGERGSPKYPLYELPPSKKKKYVAEESEKKIPLSSSFLEQRGVRHVKKYVFPYLSSEGKKKTVKEFGNIHSPSITNADTSAHGEKHDPKANHTHELASDHEGHKAGTKIKITHCSHDGKTIYAHTKEHGKIPLSKILKPKGLRTEAGGRYGWDVEKKIAKNIGSDSSAGASRHGHDFSYDIKGEKKVKGKVKVVEEKQKSAVRGESKLDKGRAGITTLEYKDGKWQYGGDNKKIHKAFSRVKIKGEDGVHRSILDHMNHHYKNGVVTKGSSHNAKGSGMTRGYLEASDVNVLHLHHKNSAKSATVTVGDSLKGKTKLTHLHDKDIDKLDGRITIEPSSPGKVRLAHSLDSSAVKALVHEGHNTLENEEHARQFVRDIENAHRQGKLKEEVSLVEHVRTIISEAKNMIDISHAINHPDRKARRSARGWRDAQREMNKIVNNPEQSHAQALRYSRHATDAEYHRREYEKRLKQLAAGKNEDLEMNEESKEYEMGHFKELVKKYHRARRTNPTLAREIKKLAVTHWKTNIGGSDSYPPEDSFKMNEEVLNEAGAAHAAALEKHIAAAETEHKKNGFSKAYTHHMNNAYGRAGRLNDLDWAAHPDLKDRYKTQVSKWRNMRFSEDLKEDEDRGADSKGHKRPTEQGAGLTRKGVMAYRRQNPGSKLSTAVTTPPSKLKPGSKAAKRRKSFCARMGGMPGPMKDEKGRPTRKAMSLRRWNCEASEILKALVEAKKMKGKDPCWKNYEMVGTKEKDGRTVPNCVPVDEMSVPLGTTGKRTDWNPPMVGIRMASGKIEKHPPGKSGSSGGGNGGDE